MGNAPLLMCYITVSNLMHTYPCACPMGREDPEPVSPAARRAATVVKVLGWTEDRRELEERTVREAACLSMVYVSC